MELYGRQKVYTDYDEITADNVFQAVEDAGGTHEANAREIRYLFDYYRGKQPIRNRDKVVRSDITYNTVVNRAQEIVAFKVSYLLSEPITYISRNGANDASKKVGELNDYMHLSGKQAADKELADDFSICGVAYRMVLPNKEYEPGSDEPPFIVSTLNPATTFVAYRKTPQKHSEPVFAATYVKKKSIGRVYDVYTKDKHFVMAGREVIEEPNPIGCVPIIEYVNNEFRIGAFEPVIDILDGANVLESNRIEATEQNVQSLLWFNDVTLDEQQINSLKENPSAFIFTKSVQGSVKPEIKNVVVQLQQADQQVLANDMYKNMLSIVGMPSTGDGNTADSSNNGSTIVRNGWQHAEARAKDTETLWRRSDKAFLEAVSRICEDLGALDVSASSVALSFPRRNYEDMMTKATVLTTLLGSDKVDPKIAYQVSKITPDPEEAYRMGIAWYDQIAKTANNAPKDNESKMLDSGNEVDAV